MSPGSVLSRVVVVLGCLYLCSSAPRKKAGATLAEPLRPARLVAAPAAAPPPCPPRAP